MEDKIPFFKKLLKEKILILDGAMGTMIQGYKFTEKDFRGTRFTNHPCDLKGNNDLLCLTRPDIVEEIHKEYYNGKENQNQKQRL